MTEKRTLYHMSSLDLTPSLKCHSEAMSQENLEIPLRGPLMNYPLNVITNPKGTSLTSLHRVPPTTPLNTPISLRRNSKDPRLTILPDDNKESFSMCQPLRINGSSSPRSCSRLGIETVSLDLDATHQSVLEKDRKQPKSSPDSSKNKCKEISLTQWILRRLRRILIFNKKKDPELEDLELTPLRYRPIAIDKLSQATKFTKRELKYMYRGFKQECPTGVISEETFKSIYCKFFPLNGQPEDGTGRNTAMYAHYVFGTMDLEGTGHITFGEFIMGLSILLKGSLQERLNWAFNLYDINNDGYITKEELIDIASSIYDLMGDEAHPGIDDGTAVEHVEKVFNKLDLNKDGVVTMDEFMEYCSKNEGIVSSLNIFNCL